MIVYRTSEGDKFKVPESWQEVKLSKFLQYFEQFNIDGLFEGETLTAHDYRYVAEYVAFWSEGIDKTKLMEGAKMADLMAIYTSLNLALSIPESIEYTHMITFEGETFYLPYKDMGKSNVFEFVEAAELESRTQQLKKNQYSCLPELCAILLRKKGEKYNKHFDEVIRPQRTKMFQNMNMQDAFKVAFFLHRRSESLRADINTYSTAKAALLQSKQRTKQNSIKALDG